jgi:hypothetical protein
MNTTAFSEYLERFWQYVADTHDLQLPRPNEYNP